MGVYQILEDVKKQNPALDYDRRMMHKIPSAEVVKRREYILEKVKDKIVVDVGCLGTDGQCTFFKKIMVAAHKAYGLDIRPCPLALPNVFAEIDAEWPGHCESLASRIDLSSVELVVAGEVLEHMSNPGMFLQSIATSMPRADLLVTVPNAFSINSVKHAQKGYENVNIDHVAWYSWRTLKTLVERYGFTVREHRWYNGKPPFSEGIIFYCEQGYGYQETGTGIAGGELSAETGSTGRPEREVAGAD